MPCSPGTRAPITTGNHWSGPSSTAEVSHMPANSTRNSGRISSRQTSRAGSCASALSVGGYSRRSAIAR